MKWNSVLILSGLMVLSGCENSPPKTLDISVIEETLQKECEGDFSKIKRADYVWTCSVEYTDGIGALIAFDKTRQTFHIIFTSNKDDRESDTLLQKHHQERNQHNPFEGVRKIKTNQTTLSVQD